jgi:hypothetical protein
VTSPALVCWAYCVLPPRGGPEGAGIDRIDGVVGAPVRIVPGPGLSLAVSDLPAAEFSDDVLADRLADERWTAALALAHFAAIEALFRAGPVLPLRLATVFSSAERAVAMLAPHQDRLSEALQRVTGSAQWTVRATTSARGGTDAEASSGTDYLRALAARRDDAAARHAAGSAAAAERHQSLTELSVAAESEPTPAPSQLLNGVYLVRGEQTGRFQDVVSRARRHSLTLDVRGPLAPYSFVPRLEVAA